MAAALAGREAQGYDAVVCAVGPGIVGTGSRLGHGALALADVANVASALGGRPVLAVRDRTPTRATATGACRTTRSPCSSSAWPRSFPPGPRTVATAGWEAACAGLPLLHMGRGPEDDPGFFRAAYAAGVVARGLAG